MLEVEVRSAVPGAGYSYRRAIFLAKEWGLRRDRLDEWIAERRAQRARGEENTGSRRLATDPWNTIGPKRPTVSVETRYSFDGTQAG